MQSNESSNPGHDTPETWFKQGISCMETGDYIQAENCFRHAIKLAPGSMESLLNLGCALDMQGRSDEAFICYESVLNASPKNAKARYNRAAYLLRNGDLVAGFADYEARFEAIRGADSRTYPQPRWDGASPGGKTILVYAEQGFGDAIMFGRYIPLLAALGAHVVLEVQAPLLRLLSSLPGVERIVEKSHTPPVTELHISLLSLPHIFRTTLQTIPDNVPYIFPPEDLVASWRDKLRGKASGFRTGLVWAGKERPYPNRTCPPEHLTPLLSLTGISFFSLQTGEKDRFPLPKGFARNITDLTDSIVDFADTAALMANLDLVITIDTSVAHLAGAMGKPVWVMLPFATDWRWMLERRDSPWYPTMKFFRQPRPDDWDSVVKEIVAALHERRASASKGDESRDDILELRFQEALTCIDGNTPDQAARQLTELLAELPDSPAIWFNLGRAHDLLLQPEEAVRCFRKALLLSPESPSIWLRLGNVLLKLNSFDEAGACLEKAHHLAPESIDILLALGAAYVQLGRNDRAFDCCRNMLVIDPGCVEAVCNMGYLQMRSGDYKAGFANFEARLAKKSMKIDDRTYQQTRWDGSPLEGRSILVFGEQGLGDVIQFSRYLPMLAEQGGQVILEIDPPLIPLFFSFPGVCQVIPKSVKPPITDVYVQLLSLPFFFGTTLETVPNRIPYIEPDTAKVAEWKQLLQRETDFRVGLVWRGNPRNPLDQDRSCTLAAFMPLTSLPNVRFFSLQVGAGKYEIVSLDRGMELIDHTERLHDLSDTAALIANLDLVIGVDTAVTHLAGAMGKSVWIMLPYIYDWRWIIGRDDSPWYPTARLFWQERRGDWDGVISRVRDALCQLLSGPDNATDTEELESLYARGNRLKEEGDLGGAEQCFRRIVSVAPELPDPQHSLAVVLHMQGCIIEAIEHYKLAIAHDPDFTQALYNLANALVQAGMPREATEYAQAVLRCDAEHADAHWLLGMLFLLQGDYQQGWTEYEWRWKARNFLAKLPGLGRPQWDGSPLQGRTLLVQMEQGRGDMLQFIRFASLAAARGGRVIVRAVPELLSLLSTAEGVGQVLDQNMPLPDFDLHIPAMSLPYALGITLKSLPSRVPYLRADPQKVEEWRSRMPADGCLRIGLSWRGASENRDNINRSCALSSFKPLADLEGIVFYSLQLGDGSEEISPLAETLHVIDVSEHIHDYADTAALIENLDLIITVCTSVTHLAGALGKPVWTLLHFASDWRWLLERDDSPWYPTMRLFRQTAAGDWERVISRVRHELELMLSNVQFHNRRGIELLQMGAYVRAEKVFSRVIELDEDNADAYCNLGATLHELGRLDEALEKYQSALNRNPDFVQALFNMGNAYRALAKLDRASACYLRVFELKPDFVPACLCLGEIARECYQLDLARQYYETALAIDSSCVDALQGVAEVFQAAEKFEEAIATYQKLLAQKPDRATTWNIMGTAYHSLEKLEDAESCYRRALGLLPSQATVLNNLGVVLIAQGRLDEAVDVYHHLLDRDPDYGEGHWNLALALLAKGDYAEGWREYEWRFKKLQPVPERPFPEPRWDGSPLAGRTILLHGEQGFGDTIQFARYAPVLAELGAKVVIECQTLALKRLLCSIVPVAAVIVSGEKLPFFDCHLPMMSLPLVCGTTTETIPSDVPYLAAEPSDIEEWRVRMGSPGNFRVGLVWFAKQAQVLNRKRSCPLRMFAPLWDIPDVEFFSLQVGIGTDQVEAFSSDYNLVDLTHHIRDFADTAAFMKNLDLVITIDTVTAHLAGALGVRTWVVLPHVAEWRWLCDRSDSPWYPTMRLFRQPSRGDWPGLMDSVSSELKNLVQRHCNAEGPAIVFSSAPEPEHENRHRAGKYVGLAWSGRLDNPLNCKRSCPIAALAPLFESPDITFFKLQPDTPDVEDTRLIDLTDQIHDFEDTAALMANLDLVISIDTSTAHLAAASGRPTWVLLAHVADWRWLTAREDSPWYPGVELFRQPDHGDWDGVVQKVLRRLGRFSDDRQGREGENATNACGRTMSGERRLLERQLASHLEMVRLQPSCPDAHLDVGAALALLGRYDEAIVSFRRVLELDAGHVAGHLNLAYSLLSLGECLEGWRHLEWRLQRIPGGQLPPGPLLRSEELGTHPSGTSVLVHCEQGFGDTILFSRFLPMLAEAGYRVVVSCQPPMCRLIASIPGVNQVIPHGEMLPVCELQTLMLSLPWLFSMTMETLPDNIPYIVPRQSRIDEWKNRLDIFFRRGKKIY